MSALRQPRHLLTPEEYLERERRAELRSEYVNGEIRAMAGGTWNHAHAALAVQLRGRPCTVAGSDMKVRIDKANVFLYPDISGLCGPILNHDKSRDAYCNPSVIVEVLSPATEAYDRGPKFALYRLLDSLFEYLLVRQDRIEVEVFTRGGDGCWTSVIYNEPADRIDLRTLDCSLTLADIYERVEFES
jgi:Uma2 family endonuclease